MSDFDSLREDLAHALETIQHAGDANVRAWTANVDDHTAIWCEIGELRDEIHALANRIENVTRGLTTEPAKTAEAMMQPYPICRCSHRYDRHKHHGRERCYECDECSGYEPLVVHRLA